MVESEDFKSTGQGLTSDPGWSRQQTADDLGISNGNRLSIFQKVAGVTGIAGVFLQRPLRFIKKFEVCR
jgi:hypothetical protein